MYFIYVLEDKMQRDVKCVHLLLYIKRQLMSRFELKTNVFQLNPCCLKTNEMKRLSLYDVSILYI